MTSRASGPLKGVAEVPGDKSISHRSLILGAMAVGETRISGLLEGEDVLDPARAMRAFGAEVTDLGGGDWSVHGVGVGGFAEPENVIDVLVSPSPAIESSCNDPTFVKFESLRSKVPVTSKLPPMDTLPVVVIESM